MIWVKPISQLEIDNHLNRYMMIKVVKTIKVLKVGQQGELEVQLIIWIFLEWMNQREISFLFRQLQ